MNPPRYFTSLLLVALIVVVAGCDSSSDTLGSSGELTEQGIEDFVGEIVAPALTQVDLRSVVGGSAGASEPDPSEGDPTPNLTQAATVDCSLVPGTCVSGSFEICYGRQSTSFIFDECSAESGMLDGSIVLLGGETSGDVNFELTAGEAGLHGSISYSVNGDCITETLTDFRATTSELVASMNGSLQYCADTWPSGSLGLSVTGTSVGGLHYQLTLGGTSTADVSVTDLGSGNSLAECRVDLVTATATCVFD